MEKIIMKTEIKSIKLEEECEISGFIETTREQKTMLFIVLRDRRHLSQDGLIVVVASVDLDARLLLSEPDIISRGFVYVRESEELMEEIRALAAEAITDRLERSDKADRMDLKTSLKDVLSKYLYNKTKRKPMVLPVIVNV